MRNAEEHTGTVGRVGTAACVEEERFKTGGRVVVAGCQAEKRIFAPSGCFDG